MILQKGFNTISIDIFIILYHIWLYHRVGIAPTTTWSQMGLSFFNFMLLRQLIHWLVPWLSFNSEYTDLTFFVIFQIGFFYLVQEFYMYIAHRIMHWNKFLYNYVHRTHHLLKAECFTTATYMSPFEIIIHIYPDVMLGPVLFYLFNGYIFKEAFVIWVCLANFYFVWSHSGVTDAQYMPSVKHHWLHHKYYNVNYGTWLTDSLFNTIKYDN